MMKNVQYYKDSSKQFPTLGSNSSLAFDHQGGLRAQRPL